MIGLLLALLLTLGLLPPTVYGDGYTERGTISQVKGTWTGFAPTLGGNSREAKGNFDVTEPTGKNVELTMATWHKKVGTEWKVYTGPNFEEGSYRLYVQLRTDSLGDKTYYRLTNNVRLFINGSEWTMEGKLHDCYSSSGFATVYFYGPEYTLSIPEGSHSVTVLNDGNGNAWADAVYSRPGYPVQLSAKADDRYRFKNWEVISGGVTVYHGKFTMGDQDVVVKAHFEPDTSLDRGTISQVRASAKRPVPVLGEAYEKPRFTITDPVGKNVEITMGRWQIKKGSTWEYYNGSTFEAGTYRYHTQLRTDSFDDCSYYRLTDNTKLYVNGVAWTKDGKLSDNYAHSGYGIIFFSSPEYVAAPPANYTVSFDPCSGSVSPASMRTDKYGMLESLPTPVREGFTFTGWFTERAYGERVTEQTRFTANTTLYAHWYETYHGISIRGGQADRSAAPSGTTVTITAETRQDCTFSKWTVESGGVTLADPNSATTTFVMGHENVSIIANYSYCDEEIDTVYLSVTEPRADKTPSDAVAESEQYRASSTRWFDAETNQQLAATDTFQGGRQYLMRVYLNTTIPFRTAGITGYVNGSTEGVTASPMGFANAQVEKVFTARPENPFVDVHESDFFFEPVMWAVDTAVTTGTDETHFSPYNTVQRCDSMVFFWAAKNRPAHADIQSPFKDVKKKHWFYDAVLWAVENSITAGTNATHFSPNNTCSRSEILQFLYAAMNRPSYSISNPYSDVKPKHWYYDGAIWAYENGLEHGENGKFNAKTPCTRGYVVTYLYRFITGKELAQ